MSKRSLTRLGVALLSLAVLAPSMAPAQAAEEIKIGVITSTSGPLASYGIAYNEGLTWGLNYYTGGKMAINGKKLVVTSKDDGADPASATASFKEMVGNGTKIVFTGDPYQIDNPYVDGSSNGFNYVVSKFRPQAIAAHVELQKGERSELAEAGARLM